MALPHSSCKSISLSMLVLMLLLSTLLLLYRSRWAGSTIAQRIWRPPAEVVQPEPTAHKAPLAVTTSREASQEKSVTMTSLPLNGTPQETAQPEVAMLSTWLSRPYKRVIHDNVLRNWPLVSPYSVVCLLYYSDQEERQRANAFSWITPPFPPTTCGGVPILREMFYAAMRAVPTARLFGFVNGDILLGAALKQTLRAVLDNPEIMSRPLLLLIRRLNVDFSVEFLIKDLATVETLKAQGQPLLDGSSDAFFTNRLFPWQHVPDLVPGRIGIGMWLVAAARALNVTVIDVTDTVTAVHLTSSAGNLESHSHLNAMCNHELLKDLGVVPSSWACGFIQCAGYSSQFVSDSNDTRVQILSKNQTGTEVPKFCQTCQINMQKLLELEMQS